MVLIVICRYFSGCKFSIELKLVTVFFVTASEWMSWIYFLGNVVCLIFLIGLSH